MPGEVSNKQIYDAVQELKQRIDILNGCVRKNTTDIAVIQSKEERNSVNWDRVIQLGLAIMQAFIIWRLMGSSP